MGTSVSLADAERITTTDVRFPPDAQTAAEKMHEMWVNSTGHRNNMLRAHHDVVGIGFWLSDDGWHATHVFR